MGDGQSGDSGGARAAIAPVSPANPAALAAAGHDERYLYGVVLALFGFGLWSTSGILLRSIDAATQWQLVFYRSATMAATLFLAVLFASRGRALESFRAAGRLSVLGGLLFALSSVCFLFSITTTTVANTVFLAATAPFFAAVLAWIVLRGRVPATTWAAMAAALAGVALMVLEGLAAGRLMGNLLAIGAALFFAGVTVVLRLGRRLDMTTAMCLGGAFAALAAAAMAPGLAVSWHDFGLCVLMGTVQLSAPLFLIVRGARHLTATEVNLLGLLEAVLNPLWVWLGVGEVPALLTLLGGALVLTAVVGQTLSGARRRSRR